MLWKLLGGAAFLAALGFAIVLFGNARFREGELARQAVEDAAALKNAATVADQRVAAEQRVTKAIEDWAARRDALQPVILTNHEKVTEYAQSPAGRVVCRDAQRVLDLDSLDAALWPARPQSQAAGTGTGAVPPDAAAPPAGR